MTCVASERASEPRERRAPSKRRARERVGESEGRSPSGQTSRTTKSGEGGAKPAVTVYSALPNAAIVVGTFVDGFDVNGSVMDPTIAPDR